MTPGWNAPQGVENVHTLCAGKPESDDRGNDKRHHRCIKRYIKAEYYYYKSIWHSPILFPGINSTAVPGEVRGLWDAHQKYGKLPWEDLFTPVIDLAEKGYRASAHLEDTLRKMELVKPLSDYDGAWYVFILSYFVYFVLFRFILFYFIVYIHF